MARVNDLEHELRKVVAGDVRFDPISRLLYSTDASMYQVEPIGVVVPRDADDGQAAVEVARKHQVALLPRGGGTSLTGQTVNRALVLDFARHMNRVVEVMTEEWWARVEPGLVQDELNHHVRPTGLLFGQDTSTSNRATLGGMLGNNSGGSHSIAYGLTVDHVIEVTALLADGTRVVFGDITRVEHEAKGRRSGLEGQIYREVARIRDEYGDEIRARYPQHWRRVAGYNLNELVAVGIKPGSFAGGGGKLSEGGRAPADPRGRPRGLNMARLVVGSEGTLLTIVEARVRLVERPRTTALDVIHYRDLQEALESSQSILETGPYAVKLTDKMILDLARENIEQSQRMGFVQGDPAAVLPKHLAEFVPRVRDVFAKHDAVGAYYGHCSVGCLHIRPVINLKTPRGLDQVRAIADEITSLVLEFGGTISSEHGDGRARSPFLERMYGPRLMRAFRELKRAFDPENRMNPGNLVDSPGIVENLRYGVGHTTWG